MGLHHRHKYVGKRVEAGGIRWRIDRRWCIGLLRFISIDMAHFKPFMFVQLKRFGADNVIELDGRSFTGRPAGNISQ